MNFLSGNGDFDNEGTPQLTRIDMDQLLLDPTRYIMFINVVFLTFLKKSLTPNSHMNCPLEIKFYHDYSTPSYSLI